jgi:anti-anti-sigma factor
MTYPLSAYEVTVQRDRGTVVVIVCGELDAGGVAHLESVLRDVIDAQGNLAVVVDAVEMILADPAGAEVFATAREWACRRGGEFTLYGPSEAVCLALQSADPANVVDVMADGHGHYLGSVRPPSDEAR